MTATPAISPPRGWRLRVESLLLLGTVGVLAVALVVAAAQLARWLRPSMHAARVEPALALTVGGVSLLALVTLALAHRLDRRGHGWAAMAIVFVVLVGLRAVAVALFPSPIVSDWLGYRDLAIGIGHGVGFWNGRPPGYPALLAVAFLANPAPLAGEILNIGLAVLGGALVVVLAQRAFGRSAAFIAVSLLAVMPSQVLFSVILASENLSGPILLALAALVVGMDRFGVRVALVTGIAFGLAQYVRAESQYFLAAALFLPLLQGRSWGHLVSVAAAAALGFAVVVSPIAAWNLEENHRVSVTPSLYDGWILYAGLSREARGQFNGPDQERAWLATGLSSTGTPPRGLPNGGNPAAYFAEDALALERAFNDAALRLGLERLRDEGPGVVLLQPGKLDVLWGRADQPISWIDAGAAPSTSQTRTTLLQELSQLGWVALLVGALWGVIGSGSSWRQRLRQLVGGLGVSDVPASSVQVTVILLFVAAFSAMHVLAQVNPRFHEMLIPLLCVPAGAGYARLGDAVRTRLRRRR